VLEVFPGWRKTISRRFDFLCRFGLAITSKARASGARLAQLVCKLEEELCKNQKKGLPGQFWKWFRPLRQLVGRSRWLVPRRIPAVWWM
jgi:hypothetical protein